MSLRFQRRDLFRQGGLLALAQAFGGGIRRAVAAPLEFGADMYRSIGVRPLHQRPRHLHHHHRLDQLCPKSSAPWTRRRAPSSTWMS